VYYSSAYSFGNGVEIRELKGFEKVFLQPGESKAIDIEIPIVELSFFDVKSGKWKTEKGEYIFSVGTSSRDISFSVTETIEKDLFFEHL